MSIRERIEKNEELILNKGARLSKDSLGREKFEPKDDFRTDFMKDRDRIIHSKSFRRLKHKTQVFIRTHEDHLRTRLTHTLEVSQVARTICRGIGLNEDLVEAITLGHDLGHVAFAHNGEEILNKLMPNGFKHNDQSIRTVSRLEKNGEGLNLTKEVLYGIRNHSGIRPGMVDTVDINNRTEKTLEGQVAKFADKIAYINHDIDDAIRYGVLNESDIPEKYYKVLGYSHSKRIDTLVRDLVENSLKSFENNQFTITMSEEKSEVLMELRSFMFKNVYLSDKQKEQREKAQFIVSNLFNYYLNNIERMPKIYRDIALEEGRERGVCDYIAGMTDSYAIKIFRELFIP